MVDLTKWFLARAKKGKGAVSIPVVEAAFAELPGWTIEPTTASVVFNGYGDDDKIRFFLPEWVREYPGHHVSSYSTKDPLVFGFNDETQASSARLRLADFVQIFDKVPKNPVALQVYSTKLGPVRQEYERFKFDVKMMWGGLPGWLVTAPNGQQKTFPHPIDYRRLGDPNALKMDSFWTWSYKNGLAEDAKKFLAGIDPEELEKRQAPAKKRQQIERQQRTTPEVRALLEEITDAKHQEVVESFESSFMHMLESYLAAPHSKGLWKWFKENRTPQIYQDFMRMAVVEDRYAGVVKAKPDAQATAHKMAVSIANDIREEFLSKNGYKLSTIVTRKGNLKKAKVLFLEEDASYGGEIGFEFKDGSSFVVRNKTVWKYSSNGVLFMQYPTTFHNVVLPGGKKKMSKPSEERMLTVFAAEDPKAVTKLKARLLR